MHQRVRVLYPFLLEMYVLLLFFNRRETRSMLKLCLSVLVVQADLEISCGE